MDLTDLDVGGLIITAIFILATVYNLVKKYWQKENGEEGT